ncbi:MAG: hypothetical protein NTU93_00105 [Arthrobacter sp.]|nr:hypothetical protein [Arthrobacter sp.]
MTTTIACDGRGPEDKGCDAVLTIEAESLARAVLQAKQAGWRFSCQYAACPQCRLPEVPAGHATIIKE